MASMYHVVATLILIYVFKAIHAHQSFPANNPQLGIYQDETDATSKTTPFLSKHLGDVKSTVLCFPLQDTWYLIYRSFENDPYFGGSPTCIAFTEKGPFENDSGPVVGQVGNDTVDGIATILSSPGYTAKNVLNLRTVGGPEINANLTIVYRDCESCKVMRHSYIDGGKGCALWQPKRAIGTDVSCCKFVYDLVCGTSTKYQVYDKC